MRNTLAGLAACVVMMGAGMLWADDAAASKEVTLKGTLTCAKCDLKETAKCQNVLKVTEGDKVVKYYLTENQTSKTSHKDVCSAPKDNVSVTGVVSEKDGKKMIEASKIEG